MKQEDLVNKIAGDIGASKAEVERTLKSLGATVQEALGANGEVTLPGIGKFSVVTRAARTGRNPRTGEALEIAAKQVPHFSAAKALKDATAG